MVEGTPKEHIELRKVLHRGGPGEPHRGRDRVAIGRQGPAAGQEREALPCWCSQQALQEIHDKRPQ